MGFYSSKTLALLGVTFMAGFASAGPQLKHDTFALENLYPRCGDPKPPTDPILTSRGPLSSSVTKEMVNVDGQAISVAYNLTFANRPVIFYTHGQGATIDDLAPFFAFAQSRHLNLISWDFPCYGQTPPMNGDPTEQTLTATGANVLKWLKQKSPNTPIVLWGQSLGAAVTFQIYKVNQSGPNVPIAGMVTLSPWDN